MRERACCMAFLATALGCAPDLTVRASKIIAARVIAVRFEPAEPRRGTTVTLAARVWVVLRDERRGVDVARLGVRTGG